MVTTDPTSSSRTPFPESYEKDGASLSADELQKALIERERSRIARDLHDGASQQIAYVLHKLELIQRSLEQQQPPQVLPEVKKAYRVLQNCLNDLHHSIASLLPVQVEEQGLIVALKALIDEYRREHMQMRIVYDIDELSLLPSRLEAPIYRIMQEALNNVLKHAHATDVAIRIHVVGGVLVVEVADNGVGFQPEQVLSGVGNGYKDAAGVLHAGLSGMRERVQEAGGSWEIQSHPGHGTTVAARFPLSGTLPRLTQRELDVLRLVTEGLSNRQIAQRLTISSETVKTHLHHIMQKLQVRDRTQAAVLAARQGWL
ncbi:MAG TPA: hybrid sensor histidine kinase/response regulator transcription factor [Ktedonobacteraceae bacterium]|nr:hybrid sensor histidine kinase/response regulator transcription factor [Ktedonobacteraceae bacterium]